MSKRNVRKSKQLNDVLKTSTCIESVEAAQTVESNGEFYNLKRHLDGNKRVGVYEKSSNDSMVVFKVHPTVTCINGTSSPNGSRQVMMKLCDHSALRHLHIDQCKDLSTDENGTLYTKHDWYSGGSLLDAWEANKPSNSEIVVWLYQSASAHEHAHQHGILHGDIKLANTMKRGERDFVVADWDQASNLTDIKRGASDYGFGTETYRSKEQIKCHHEYIKNGTTYLCRLYSMKTDVFQLGCALCKILFSETTDYDSVNCETLNFEKNLICPANVDPFQCELAKNMVKEEQDERPAFSNIREMMRQQYPFLVTEDTNVNKTFAQIYSKTSRIQSVVETPMPETSCTTEQQSSCVPTKTETESSSQQQPSRQTDQQSSHSSSTMSKLNALAFLAGAPIGSYCNTAGKPTTPTHTNHNDSNSAVVVEPVTTANVEPTQPTQQPLLQQASTCSASFNTPSGCVHKPSVGGICLQSKPVRLESGSRVPRRNQIFGRRNVPNVIAFNVPYTTQSAGG